MLQVVRLHREFLARVLKGCLLARKVKLLRNLMELKALANNFAAVSAALRINTDSLDADRQDRPSGMWFAFLTVSSLLRKKRCSAVGVHNTGMWMILN
jgi:hypothetical protein